MRTPTVVDLYKRPEVRPVEQRIERRIGESTEFLLEQFVRHGKNDRETRELRAAVAELLSKHWAGWRASAEYRSVEPDGFAERMAHLFR